MRVCAFAGSQPWVAVCLMSVWPETTFRVPSSIFGLRIFIAPLKKTAELASSGEPENSSML